MANAKVENRKGYSISAQNVYNKKSGAYTGEVSAEMLKSINISYSLIGHSERREYFRKATRCWPKSSICCWPMALRLSSAAESHWRSAKRRTQNSYVAKQLEESLFHLSAEVIAGIVIAYEPIWAIGTGKTASAAQAQEIHAYLRSVLAGKYGQAIADSIPVLYGGSVKGNNAQELFSCPDVDGGLVGGASLNAEEFATIIRSLP